MNFDSHFTRQSKVAKFVTNSGSSTETVYEYRIVDGVQELVPVGETDIYAKIQSFEPSCNINNIIARFMNGDVDALNVRYGSYGDFSHVPTTYAELYERLTECDQAFNRLPIEIRKEFDNSSSKFWSDYGSERFNAVFSNYFASKEDKPVETVIDESEVK